METIELVAAAQVRDETPRVRSYVLRRLDGAALPASVRARMSMC